tara:strand:- start:324 stop:599 length:276 start_codon:yes stop_codon:yes gene_type:complete
MKELSLFSGAGGGLLGTKLLGWEHCGYVEFNDYCQRVIAQRIDDGFLDEAPIFSDIKAFISIDGIDNLTTDQKAEELENAGLIEFYRNRFK